MNKIGGVTIHNTKDLINPSTRLCGLVWAVAKIGKTTFGASLDAMTKKFFGKPTLFLAIEPGEGGGTMSIRQFGVDYVVPKTFEELKGIVRELYSDTHYGGIVLDSSTCMVKHHIQPDALKLPNPREKDPRRALGVPGRSDYQTMGEMTRQIFNALIGLTTVVRKDGEVWVPDLDRRKHLLVTATDKTITDDETGEVVKVGPDLPGAMFDAATAMFQTVMTIVMKREVDRSDPKVPKTITRRTLVTKPDGKKILGDRMNLLPEESVPDMVEIYEKYWLPQITAQPQPQA